MRCEMVLKLNLRVAWGPTHLHSGLQVTAAIVAVTLRRMLNKLDVIL